MFPFSFENSLMIFLFCCIFFLLDEQFWIIILSHKKSIMEIDEDCNSNVFKKPTTTGLSFQNFVRPTSHTTSATISSSSSQTATTTSFSQMNTPSRSSHCRRGSSGIFFNTMFCMSHHFRHLKRLHMESMEGLNIIKQPPARAVFRSSLPATPIATPIYRESFPFFTEQTLMERLCRTPSPRRSYSRNSSQMDTSECEMQQPQHQHQPMEICSPTTIDEESLSISSNSASSPNKERPMDEKQNSIDNTTTTDIQSSLNDIYYKISDQFNPD